jgi:hypothetical protein
MQARGHWRGRNDRLDPVRDAHEISLNVSTYEFPWDTLQALSFALLRTYAVPSIGRILGGTGEFTERVQKRYDDTGLLLEEIQQHGLGDTRGRDAVRRINQMHAMYDIDNNDMRYVLATFIVVPKRWLDDYGYRSLTPIEVAASTNYYLELGRHMAIRDLPADYAGFERLMDAYEREHFGFDPGGRAVADATIELFTTFPLNRLAPAWLLKRFVRGVMDKPLRDAFGYPALSGVEERIYRGALRLRGRLLRFFPARSRRRFASDMGHFQTYPDGYRTAELGTFAAGCPVPHEGAQQRDAS